MRRVIGVTVLFLLILGGCSSTKCFSGIVFEVKEDVILVDCSDEVKNTQDASVYDCQAQLPEETLVLDANGEPIDVAADLNLIIEKGYVRTEVTLVSKNNLIEDMITL